MLTLCGVLLCVHAGAQNKNITGTVFDTQGAPMPGAMVAVKDSPTATITGTDGKFSLSAPTGGTLVFSFLGYSTQERPVGTSSVINITMETDVTSLENVVVVGYGTMRKKDLTGAVTQVLPDRLANENPKTVQDILRGTPGLSVGYNSDAKGGGSMSIRGQRSVYTDGGHNDPLLILDGMIFYGELSEINPDDIGQIDILKDASAAAVYGAQAANGVVLITTKKGKQGKPVVNFSANVGWMEKAEYRERFSPDAYMQHRVDWLEKSSYGVNSATGGYESYQVGAIATTPGYYTNPNRLPAGVSIDQWRGYTSNAAGASDNEIWARRLGFAGNALQNYLNGKTVDWTDLTYRKGFTQDYNASVGGAGEWADYYFSMGYLKNQGTRIDDEYESVRANLKVNARVTKWFELGANVNFQNRSDGRVGVDQDAQLRNSPYADYKDENGNLVQFPLDANYAQRGYNYEFERNYIELEKGYTTFNTILNAKVKLPFNVTYSFNASPRYQFFYDRYFTSASLPGSDLKSRGVNREQTKRFQWALNNTINWDHTFNNKHHVMVTLVQEAEEKSRWKDRIEARNIKPTDALGFHNTENGEKEYSIWDTDDITETADALLARVFYSYDNRYMITTSIRRDGYSAFGSSNPYATFPSVGVAWTFTNEDFFRWTDIMNHGKLRASWGKNGNRALDNPYLALANLGIGSGKTHAYVNSSGQLVQYKYLMADRMANPNLRWETSVAYNIGLDFGFLRDRITGSVEYYRTRTDDMIMKQRLPIFTGFENITTNLGLVVNSGVEVTLNTKNIDRQNFTWNTTVGFSYNKNTIKKLYGVWEDVYGEPDPITGDSPVIGRKEQDDTSNKWFIGQPISAIWDYEVIGIWQKDEAEEAKKYGQKPGDPKVANHYTANDKADGTPVYDDKDKVFQGQTAPPVHWSIRNDFTFWKDLTFSFNIYSYMGHKSLEGFYLNNDDDGGRMRYSMANLPAKEYWTLDNPTNEYGAIDAKSPNGTTNVPKLYKRGFVRLENITVGYTLPRRWTEKVQLDRVKVYSSVRNVAVLHDKMWKYGDPEAYNSDSNPERLGTRVYTFGMNITF
jgi:TonB-linked SusC/RagA family outer membrane protein